MADEPKPGQTVTYHYLKSTGFRVVHADGIFGGATPQGFMQLAFFNERFPIPQQAEYAIQPGEHPGEVRLGEEKSRTSKPGMVREVEFSVVMTLEIAKVLRTWLEQQIARMEAKQGTAT